MNYRMIGFVLGRILLTESALLALSMLVALLYRESFVPFLIPIALLLLVGSVLGLRHPKKQIYYD